MNPSSLSTPVSQKENLVLCRPNFSGHLSRELEGSFGLKARVIHPAVVALSETSKIPALNEMVFARQIMPNALPLLGSDPASLAAQIFKRIEVLTKRENRQTGVWTLHGFSMDDDLGLALALKIEKSLKQIIKAKLPEFFARYVGKDLFSGEPRAPHDFMVQILGTGVDSGYFSIASLASGVSTFEGGIQRMKRFHGAPSRSASKLSEALLCLGKTPERGEKAVDLGAAPGGWSMVLAFHGADVVAVDHGKLEIDPKAKLQGTITHLLDNGLKYLPSKPVDWMTCDMVMKGSQTLGVLKAWLDGHHMKNFVVNVKLPHSDSWDASREALEFCECYRQSKSWKKFFAKHLYHDRHELTLMGTRA